MLLKKVVQLMRQYEECPQCGNHFVGNGEGAIEVTDSTFIRSCKCGWKVEITDGDE